MEYLAGSAAIGAGASLGLFEYNRDNFKYDRDLRLKKELALQKFRIKQAELWREDVRDLVSLTEYKMHVYLLINVLLIGQAVVLWCEGKLPPHTPTWLMTGSCLSICGAFMFLMLSLWMAMHAAVTAQSYEARLLTQLTRLPIPTWPEVEACRTYASDFEAVRPNQMFRVPWLMGKQEDLEAKLPPGCNATSDEDEEGADMEQPITRGISEESINEGHNQASDDMGDGVTADPWGMERRGSDIIELGCRSGSEVAKLRHVQLSRQAMVHWQSYDAFARICMSIGINQLISAMSYYMLGYILVEVGCRTGATYGVVLLTVLSEIMMRLDMSLTWVEQRVMQVMLAGGPLLSLVASYHWSVVAPMKMSTKTAEALITVSFLLHGLLLAFIARCCRIKETEGMMLPVAFRSVLYLDVFGWVNNSSTTGDDGGTSNLQHRFFSRESVLSGTMSPSKRQSSWLRAIPRWFSSSRNVGGTPGRDNSSFESEDASANGMNGADGLEVRGATGERPCRPEDFAQQGGVSDMRDYAGAPPSNARGANHSDFYESAYWMPGKQAGSVDRQADSGAFESDIEDEVEQEEVGSIVTGHLKETSQILPWRIFCSAMLLCCLTWIFAGIYHGLGVSGYIKTSHGSHHTEYVVMLEKSADMATDGASPGTSLTSLLGLRAAVGLPRGPGAEGAAAGGQPERVAASWPFSNIQPISLSCDAAGRWFSVTDGLILFAGVLDEDSAQGKNETDDVAEAEVAKAARLRQPRREPKAKAPSPKALELEELECSGLEGQGLQDVAVACDEGGEACDALVLHGHGRRIASCALPNPKEGDAERQQEPVATVSDSWLAELRDSGDREEGEEDMHGRVEKASSIAVGNTCANRSCALLSTTGGRVVELRASARRTTELVPASTLHERGTLSAVESFQSRPVRLFGDHYFGILQSDDDSTDIIIHDTWNLGNSVGRISLPHPQSVVSFCAGGGYFYFLGKGGHHPELSRIPMPRDLLAA